MKLRSRIAVIATMVLMLIGVAGAANAANASSLVNQPSTSTNGCVLVEPVQLGFCLSRL